MNAQNVGELKALVEAHVGRKVSYPEIEAVLKTGKSLRASTALKLSETEVQAKFDEIVASLQSTPTEPPASQPTEAPAPVEPVSAEPAPRDPAYDAFQAWWDENVSFADDAFTVIDVRPLKENKAINLVCFVPGAGGRRWIDEREYLARQKRGTYGGYLLNKEMEAVALKLVQAFPGCPTLTTTCSSCDEPLFGSERALIHYLRERVLERILMGLVPVDSVRWFDRHKSCIEMGKWEANYTKKRLAETDRLRKEGVTGHKELAEAITKFEAAACKKGQGVVTWLFRNGHITRAKADQLRAHVYTITNTTPAPKAPKEGK